MRKKTIIRICRGLGEIRYCACDNAGNPIRGFSRLSDIRKHWKKEIKWGYVELVRELDKTPDMEDVNATTKCIKTILKSHTYGRKERGQELMRKQSKLQGRLGYNTDNGRYGLLSSDLWINCGFHCGDCLEVKVDDRWEKTRMEMTAGQEWYLVGTPYCGDLEYVQARILA